MEDGGSGFFLLMLPPGLSRNEKRARARAAQEMTFLVRVKNTTDSRQRRQSQESDFRISNFRRHPDPGKIIRRRRCIVEKNVEDENIGTREREREKNKMIIEM